MRKSNAIPWWGWLVWIAALGLGIVAYNHMPMQVPLHYDLEGKADRMGSPLTAVLVEPVIMLVIIVLWHVLWRIDPKTRNYESFWPTYRYIGGIIVAFIGLMYLSTLGHLLNIASTRTLLRFGPTIFGIMILLLSNVLPRLQSNWWVGIRTPWTLSSDDSWRHTHRLAGHLGIPTGALIVILVWALPNAMISMAILIPIILWVLVLVVASYFYAQQK